VHWRILRFVGTDFFVKLSLYSLDGRGGSTGGLEGAPAPLQLVQQWRYEEGEEEEEVEERRKMEREEKEEEISPPSIVFCIRHCLMVMY
jgi:hypothetical protein